MTGGTKCVQLDRQTLARSLHNERHLIRLPEIPMNFSRRFWIHWAIGLSAALAGMASHAQDALDNVLKARKITIAIPTDFPPYGFVGTDLKPQGLDLSLIHI